MKSKVIDSIRQWANGISESTFSVLMFASLLLLSLSYCFHGIDMTDEGWVLCGYQQIFQHPDSVGCMFYMYNTLLVGGVWEMLFGGLGIIGFKVLCTLFVTLTWVIVYVLLRKSINRWVLFVTLAYLTIGGIGVISYNFTSILAIMLCIYCMYNSLLKEKSWLMGIGGVILGLAVFFRFPNLALTGMILVLIVNYIHTREWRKTATFLGLAVGGFIIGIGLNVLLMVILHHWGIMQNMFSVAFSMVTSDDSSHSLQGMLMTYMSTYRLVLKYMYPLLFFPALLYLVDKWEKNLIVKKCLYVVLTLLFGYLIFRLLNKGNVSLHSICCVTFILVFLKRDSYSISDLYLSTLAFLLMSLMPLGSDGGIVHVRSSLFLALPFSFGILWKELKEINAEWAKYIRICAVCVMCVVLLNAIVRSTQHSYRDEGSKFQKTAMITQSVVPTTLTNPDKARVMDNLLIHLKPLVGSGRTLISYPSIPMVNYLTNTPSYMSTPWGGILNDAVFDQDLAYAEQTKSLPVIVLSKASHEDWYKPLYHWESVLDCQDWRDITHKNEVLHAFIQRHGYKAVYETNLFQVLQTDEE